MTPTIILDPSFDLHEAGLLNTEASRASFAAAYSRAARRLGFDVALGRYQGPQEDEDHAGLSDEQCERLWQSAHDAIAQSRPGRWHVVVLAAQLRARGRKIKGL